MKRLPLFPGDLNRNPDREAGFSLVEMLVVIAVIGILAGIAIPSLSNIYENSRFNSHKRNAQNIASVYASARAAGATIPATDVNSAISALDTGVYGKGALSTTLFQLGGFSAEDLAGAKRFLVYDPANKILLYGPATDNPFNVNANGEVYQP